MTLELLKFWVINPTKTKDTNLCTNPSFETGTTGWTTGGTNVIATSAVQQRRGVYSCRCIYSNNDLLASYAITLMTDTDHVASMDIYIPSDYEGTELTLTWTGFTSATIVAGKPDMTIRDKWQRVHAHIIPDSEDFAGTLTLSETGTNGDATEFIYIDGVQIVARASETTYFDGDTDEYCYWSGQQNASTSIRRADSRNGGTLVDLEDYMHISSFIGFGMNPIAIAKTATAGGRSLYQRTNKLDREMIIIGEIIGNNYDDLQTNRKALLDLFKPDLVSGEQEVTIRYMATTSAGKQASEIVDVRCRMKSDGLIGHWSKPTQEPITLMFEAYDDLMRDGNDAVSLDYNDTLANANYIVKRDRDGAWSVIGSGANGTVQDIKYFKGYYYVAGDFTSFNGTAVNRICKIDLDGNVTALGDGFNAVVYSIAIGADGTLYCVGEFTASGATSIDYTAYFDGTDWQELGGGANGITLNIDINNDGDIYCTCWGGSLGVAKLTAGTWVEIGNLNLSRDIEFTSDGEIFVTNPYGVDKYNTGTSSFDNVISGGWGKEALKIIDNNIYSGSRYVAGAYTGVLHKHSASTYTKLKEWVVTGSVVSSGFRRIRQYDNIIYAVGTFDSVDGYTISDGIITLINDQFVAIDINFPGHATVNVVEQDDKKNLFFGFNTSGDATVAGDDTITNDGTTTRPKFTITGPGLLRQIVNTTNNKGVYFNNFTLLAGEVVTLDFEKQTFTSTFRGNVLSYVLEGISTLDFTLEPGDNRITTFIDGTTDSNTTATMQWKVKYWSLDEAKL